MTGRLVLAGSGALWATSVAGWVLLAGPLLVLTAVAGR